MKERRVKGLTMNVSEIIAEIDGLDENSKSELLATLGGVPVNEEPKQDYVAMSDYADTIEQLDALTETVKQITSDYSELAKENNRLRDDISHFIRTGVSPVPNKPVNPNENLVDALF